VQFFHYRLTVFLVKRHAVLRRHTLPVYRKIAHVHRAASSAIAVQAPELEAVGGSRLLSEFRLMCFDEAFYAIVNAGTMRNRVMVLFFERLALRLGFSQISRARALPWNERISRPAVNPDGAFAVHESTFCTRRKLGLVYMATLRVTAIEGQWHGGSIAFCTSPCTRLI
jgi:hypothetical protein